MPTGKSQGTAQSYDFCAAGTFSTIAVLAVTQLLDGPLQRTRLTVTPSVGWPLGSQVTVNVSP